MTTTFGKTLRAMRERAGCSVTGLARHLGVSVPYLSDVEHGRRAPLRDELLRQACALLGGDIDDLGLLVWAAAQDRGHVELPFYQNAICLRVLAQLQTAWPTLSVDHLLQLDEMTKTWISSLKKPLP